MSAPLLSEIPVPRHPKLVHTRVLVCFRVDGTKADMWRGQRKCRLTLTCGHRLVKLLGRRLLVGEYVACPDCTAAKAKQQALPIYGQEQG